MDFYWSCMLLRLSGLWMWYSFCLIQWRLSNLGDVVKESSACIWTFTDWFLSNSMWWYSVLKCIVSYQFVWPWPSFKVIVLRKIQRFCAHFLTNFSFNLDEIEYTAKAFRSVQAHVKCYSHDHWILRGENSLVCFTWNTFNICLHSDAAINWFLWNLEWW